MFRASARDPDNLTTFMAKQVPGIASQSNRGRYGQDAQPVSLTSEVAEAAIGCIVGQGTALRQGTASGQWNASCQGTASGRMGIVAI